MCKGQIDNTSLPHSHSDKEEINSDAVSDDLHFRHNILICSKKRDEDKIRGFKKRVKL